MTPAAAADVLQLIRDDIKDIKDSQKELRTEITTKFSTIHKRVDDLVKEKYQCELNCKERDNALDRQMWKTSGIMAGAINFMAELGKWVIGKIT